MIYIIIALLCCMLLAGLLIFTRRKPPKARPEVSFRGIGTPRKQQTPEN